MVRVFGPDKDGLYTVKGYPAGAKVGLFFGILLLIIGWISVFVNTVAGTIVISLGTIILFASNRYANHVKQKVINRYAAQLKGQRPVEEQANKIAELERKLAELEAQKKQVYDAL